MSVKTKVTVVKYGEDWLVRFNIGTQGFTLGEPSDEKWHCDHMLRKALKTLKES